MQVFAKLFSKSGKLFFVFLFMYLSLRKEIGVYKYNIFILFFYVPFFA